MIILLLIGIGVTGIVLSALLEHKNELASKTACITGTVALVICAVMLVIACISYPISLSTVSNMENFSERNNRIFSEAIAAFPDATTVKTSNDTTETVRLSWDYTKNVLSYNNQLKWYKRYQHNWFYGFFVTTVPDQLVYIELKR